MSDSRVSRTISLNLPAVEGQQVRFTWDVEPPSPIYRRHEFTITFPPSVDPGALPPALWAYIALVCLHSHWPLLRPCTVILPHNPVPGVLEAWSRLVEAECWTLDAFPGSPYEGSVELVAGPVVFAYIPPATGDRCAAAFSGGKDSLVQAALLGEVAERPLLVTTHSPLPGLNDHDTERRRFVMRETVRSRDVDLVEVQSDYRACFENLWARRPGFPVSVNEVSDTFLYFATLLAVGLARGARHFFVAGETEIQETAVIAGRIVQYEQYMYSLATQRALAVLLQPFGISYGSLVAPLYHGQIAELLHTRYVDLARLQYSCWEVPAGKAACSRCRYCMRNTFYTLLHGHRPSNRGLDTLSALQAPDPWAPAFVPGTGPELPTDRGDRLIDAQGARALLATPVRTVVREVLRTGGRRLVTGESVRAWQGYRKLRSSARTVALRAPDGYRPGFVGLLDSLVRDGVGEILASTFPPAEDDGAAARSAELTAWITEPLERAGG